MPSQALQDRILRPARPRLRAAHAAVCPPCPACGGGRFAGARGQGYDDVCDGCAGAGDDPLATGQEAWEALAARGVIPLGWAADPPAWRCFRQWTFCLRCLLSPRRSTTTWLAEPERPRQTVLRCDACDGLGELGLALAHPPSWVEALALGSDPDAVATAECVAREREPAGSVEWRCGPFAQMRARCDYGTAAWHLGDRGAHALLATGFGLVTIVRNDQLGPPVVVLGAAFPEDA